MRACAFGSVDPSALVLDPSASSMTKPSSARLAYRYTGEERGVVFERSSTRSSSRPGSIRMSWTRGEFLGITFVEKRGSGGKGVVVGKTTNRACPVRVGDELLRVQGIPVDALDIASVLRVLQTAPSPCVLELAASSSCITLAQPSAEMKLSGIERDMVLESINGEDMTGATLDEVSERIKRANRKHPASLVFKRQRREMAPRSLAARQQDEAQLLRKTHARNGLSVAAVLAALSF